MKIVHVTDGYVPRAGGIELHVHDLAHHQAAAGHEVSVLTTVPGAAGDGQIRVVRPGGSSGESHGGLRPFWTLVGFRSSCLATADIVHVHTSTVSPLAAFVLAARGYAGAPTVATMHSMLVGNAFIASSAFYKWAGYPFSWRAPSTIWTAVSNPAAARLRAALGSGTPIAVLPNAVDPRCWSAARSVPGEPDRLAIVTAGRLARRKRHRALLDALHTARRRLRPEVRLAAVIAGEGPWRSSLERFVRDHEMTDWVQMPGTVPRSELGDIYARADVYVASARLESFGIAALEARCAGLPVIAFRDSGVGDFIRDGVDGLLVRDDGELADALTALGDDRGLLERLQRNARASLPPFTWEQVLPLTEQFYVAAMNRSTRSRQLLTAV
jgi:glycosyltransferase involved in cell wall biosynthesis